MRCPNCGTENPEGARFCTQCRAPLTSAAPQPPSGGAQPIGASPQPPGPIGAPPVMGAYYYPPPAPAPVGRQRFPTCGIIAGGLAGLLLCCIVIVAAAFILGLVSLPFGPAPTPAPPTQPQPPVQPQPQAPPTQPTLPPTQPTATPTRTPTQPPPPAPPAQPSSQPPSAAGALQIFFCKDIISQGEPVGCGDVFSTRDPQIVQVTIWGEGRLPSGTRLTIDWFFGNVKVVEAQYNVQPNVPGHIFTVTPPTGGWPVGRYEAQVSINGARAATAAFAVR